MSYNPIPPRVWSRVQNQCTYVDSDNSYNNVYVPIINKPISLAESDYLKKLLYKGNILQHKANSSRLTKKQQYTQIAKGLGPARRKVFATQSQTYTNPNTAGFLRVNYETFNYPNNLVGEPNNISGPFQYNVPNPWDCSSNSIQDGGNLVCGTYADPCSGEIIKTSVNPALICNPTYCSDVPGTPISLCWNSRIQTWFPRVRRTMSNSGTGWPEGYKGFVSALTPDAPFLTMETTETTLTLSWTYTDSNCIPVTGFNIYQNGILIQTLPYTITTFTINDICSASYFVTSLSTNIESQPSNNVTSFNLGFTFENGNCTIDYTNNWYKIEFTQNGSITISCSQYKSMKIILCGGGGGGIGGDQNTMNRSGGGGGGGAEVNQILFDNSYNLYSNITTNVSNNIIIGTGGSSETYAQGKSGYGGDTSIQLIYTYKARGGSGTEINNGGEGGGGALAETDGIITTDDFQTLYGGGGGGNSNNDENGGGGGGAAYDFSNNTFLTTGGKGGQNGSFGGEGGENYGGNGGNESEKDGISGIHGGGGGGGRSNAGNINSIGGKGGDGFCIIFLSPII